MCSCTVFCGFMHVHVDYSEIYIIAISSGVYRQQNVRELMGQWVKYPRAWGGGGGFNAACIR